MGHVETCWYMSAYWDTTNKTKSTITIMMNLYMLEYIQNLLRMSIRTQAKTFMQVNNVYLYERVNVNRSGCFDSLWTGEVKKLLTWLFLLIFFFSVGPGTLGSIYLLKIASHQFKTHRHLKFSHNFHMTTEADHSSCSCFQIST